MLQKSVNYSAIDLTYDHPVESSDEDVPPKNLENVPQHLSIPIPRYAGEIFNSETIEAIKHN